MEKHGTNLEFVSKIHKDGTGVTLLNDNVCDTFRNATYQLTRLSISERTFIAANMTLFVVRIKEHKNAAIALPEKPRTCAQCAHYVAGNWCRKRSEINPPGKRCAY